MSVSLCVNLTRYVYHNRLYCEMQEERDESNDNSVADSAAFTDASSQHHSADTDDAQSNDNSVAVSAAFTDASSQHHSAAQSIREEIHDEELETENKKNGNGAGYEGLDPQEVEEARLRAQQPSVYVRLQRDDLEDLYSRPKKKR